MIKLGDALWNKNRHIKLQMIQCDWQENIEMICNLCVKTIITEKKKKRNTNI